MSKIDTKPFSAIPCEDGKQETEPDKLCQALEIKLANERAAWERAHAQHQMIRAASFVFLFLAILGVFAALYFVSQRAQEHRVSPTETVAPAK